MMKIQQINPNIRTLKDLKNFKRLTHTKNTSVSDNFAEPIFISQKEMQDYTKQILERVSHWKKIFD